ncbi:MAG TPA: hypothetical protein VF681_02505 [Abditibacteriaceae bacterium]
MKLFFRAAAALSLALATTGSGIAAPKASTLSFNVAARLTSGGNAQSLTSRVLAKGNRVRLETRMGEQNVIFLAAPPYLYKLIPASKAGVRWKNDKWSSSRFDLQALLRNPSAIRAQLKARGAKSIGTQKVGGTLTDILLAKNAMGRGTDVKAWLRRGDALPLRLEAKSKNMNGVVTWSNYRRDTPLADALFQVPQGYNVRERQGRPGLM